MSLDDHIVIVCHSPSVVEDLKIKIKGLSNHLIVGTLTGLDDSKTKKEAFEHINETVLKCNIFIYSPVIESGVDITIKIKKFSGF